MWKGDFRQQGCFRTESGGKALGVIRDALKDVVEGQSKLHDVGTNVGVNVGTNEEKVLALLVQDSRLTAKTLASTIGLTDRQVERILSKLKTEGKIIRHGASKNGYWEVCCTCGAYPL